MKRIILALAIASLSSAASAGPPVPSVNIANTPLPVDVVTSDVIPLADLGPTTRVTCPAASGQCERRLDIGDRPVALYELQYSILPGAATAPDGVQCWMRVHLLDDTSGPHEIVKFAWPANDLHGVIHTLAAPVALQPDQNPILRLVVGSNLAEPGDLCNAEVKLYTRSY